MCAFRVINDVTPPQCDTARRERPPDHLHDKTPKKYAKNIYFSLSLPYLRGNFKGRADGYLEADWETASRNIRDLHYRNCRTMEMR